MAAADRFREGGMTTRLIIGAVFVGLFTWIISRMVNRWAEAEAQAERERFDRIMAANCPPRAAGLRSDHRRVS
jgi:hypothetical protein